MQIFGLVDPVDLLHLSRASKSFHKFLVSKMSAQVWRKSLERIRELTGLPECPPELDLSEPKFTALVYGNICNVCLLGYLLV